MENLKIEKGVPITNEKTGMTTGMAKLLRKMEVGDSVFFKDLDSLVLGKRARSTANYINIKISIRKVEGGARLWRIE